MRALRLERFMAAEADLPAAETVDADTEARLETYEQGYAAGWEDAAAAQQDDRSQTEEQVTKALMSLAHSAADARRHVLAALRPLIEAMVAQVVPALARDSLAALVADTVLRLAEDCADRPLTLRLHPAARSAVEAHLARLPQLSVILAEDDSLTPGQVLVAAGPAGARIDLDGALSEIAAAVRAFHDLLPMER